MPSAFRTNVSRDSHVTPLAKTTPVEVPSALFKIEMIVSCRLREKPLLVSSLFAHRMFRQFVSSAITIQASALDSWSAFSINSCMAIMSVCF
jgi:hypothetical protein